MQLYPFCVICGCDNPHRRCRHENIIMFMGACTRPPELGIVMEWCAGATLYHELHVKVHISEFSNTSRDGLLATWLHAPSAVRLFATVWKTNRARCWSGNCILVRWSKHHLKGSAFPPPTPPPCQEEEEQLSMEEAVETAVQTARGMGYALCEIGVEYCATLCCSPSLAYNFALTVTAMAMF